MQYEECEKAGYKLNQIVDKCPNFGVGGVGRELDNTKKYDTLDLGRSMAL